MKTSFSPTILNTTLASLLFVLSACSSSDDSDNSAGDNEGPSTLYMNANILTLDEQDTIADAIIVTGDIITAVGSEQELRTELDADASVIDLDGKTMIPGIYDAHSHFVYAGITELFNVNLNSPPIGDVESIEQLVAKLTAAAENIEEGNWIQGFGYDDTLLTELRHPTREDLDRVSTTHPILITHTSGHLAVANSLALEMAGITSETPQPEGGAIRFDENGEPNGVLEEPSAMTQVSGLIPANTAAELTQAIRSAAATYSSQGVTTANDGAAPAAFASLIDLVASSSAGLPIRVNIWPTLDAVDAVEAMEFMSDRITIGGVKDFADGSIQGYTGYLSQPYYVTPEDQPDDYVGFPRYEREALAARIKEIHDAGRQAIIHGNGDAAIDDILYGIRQAQETNPREDTRHVVIHSQMAREDQLDEMQALGVIPSYFVLHTYYWGDRHRDIFMGPERAFRMSPTQSSLARAMPYTIHTDTPVVPMEPMRLIWSAVNRTSTSDSVIGAEQAITPLEALKATTINAAYSNFEESTKGSIEVGKLADLVVLSDDPLTVDPSTIKDIVVEQTILGGETVYTKE